MPGFQQGSSIPNVLLEIVRLAESLCLCPPNEICAQGPLSPLGHEVAGNWHSNGKYSQVTRPSMRYGTPAPHARVVLSLFRTRLVGHGEIIHLGVSHGLE